FRCVLVQGLQICKGLLMSTHVTQDADGADDFAVRIAQGRSVQARWYDFARCTTRIETRVTNDTTLDDLAQGSSKLTRFFGTDEARKRLLQHFVSPKTK